MRAKLFDFEGGRFTAADINKMVPIYSMKSLRSYLAEDPTPTTIKDLHVIAAQRAASSRAASSKNAKRYKETDHKFFKLKGSIE